MVAFTFKRLFDSFIVLIVVSVIIFTIMRVLPGDPILIYLSRSERSASSPEQIAALYHEYGLDKPLPQQYMDWLSGIVQGNLGKSIFKQQTVVSLIGQRLPITMYLGIIAFVLSIIIGIAVGVISAVRRNTWVDTVSTVLANLGVTMPIFWLGILMVYFFGLYLNVLPIFGFTSPFSDLGLSLKQSIMPVICLAVFSVASIARQTRSSMLEVIRQDYIRTAWAKGLKEQVIITRHALKNSLIPVVTLAGTQIRNIVGGAVLTETVFNIPGMGRLAVDGIFNQDYAVVQGVILIISVIIVATNLVVDFSYGWIDPRIRYA
jgi:peptide/nickel transport system permease protein